jgi:hypothetical protein
VLIRLSLNADTTSDQSETNSGKEFRNLPDAEAELAHAARHIPDDCAWQRVVYEVVLGGHVFEGSFELGKEPSLARLRYRMLQDYGIDLDYAEQAEDLVASLTEPEIAELDRRLQ